ncbi:MAG TPA: hypothetical protein VI160_09285 [Gemmatimonadales bacterium]
MVVLVSIIPLRRAALSQGVDVTGVALTWSGIAVTVLTIIRPRWFNIPMRGEYAYPDSAGVGNHVLYLGLAIVALTLGVWRLSVAPVAASRCARAIARAISPDARVLIPPAHADTMLPFPAGLILSGQTCSSLLNPRLE